MPASASLTPFGPHSGGCVCPHWADRGGDTFPKVARLEGTEQSGKATTVTLRPGSLTVPHRWMVPEFLRPGVSRVRVVSGEPFRDSRTWL